MTDTVHMLKERKGKDYTTRCGKRVAWASIWNSDVTCPECLEHIKPLEQPRKRIIKRI